jgi:NAD(P)-dependent dehydrogenase (short-subunit alcohol dehydrogenase family)
LKFPQSIAQTRKRSIEERDARHITSDSFCLLIDHVRQVFAINLKASFVAAQEFGRKLLELKRPGKIINIASIISFIANINIAAYACTKGGVLQMTKAFSNEWAGKGINVNCICPGYAPWPSVQERKVIG